MGHSSSPDDSAIDAQIAQNNAELQARRENLMQTRLGIIKASDGQDWDTDIPASGFVNSSKILPSPPGPAVNPNGNNNGKIGPAGPGR